MALRKKTTQKSASREKSPLKKWPEIEMGGVILTPGNAWKYQTGNWVNQKLIWKPETCIHCLFCWINCPDGAIKVKEGKVVGIDLEHCKNCGICVESCPTKPKSFEMKNLKEGERKF